MLVVVVNDEEQYSIRPAGRELPAGWRAASAVQIMLGLAAVYEDLETERRELPAQWPDCYPPGGR